MKINWHPISERPESNTMVWLTMVYDLDGVEHRYVGEAVYDAMVDAFIRDDGEDTYYNPEAYNITNAIAWAYYETPAPYEG